MQLIGMLDSPYVRRVAISLQVLGLPYTHRSLSVFRTYEHFKAINPVVKAPTLVCDDGTMLMDSTLILDYAESLTRPRSLLPAEPAARAADLRTVGLALAACEKTVQLVYERQLRPSEKQFEPWVQRVTEQLLAALRALEAETPALGAAQQLTAATIAAAISWRFTREKVPDALATAAHPRLRALSEWAEAQPEFLAAPYDDTTLHV